ncbi:MAG: glycosyltransferase family 2 protein [Bacteroidales bacterium]|nr:glycosyltransferase family 2 protein [Bacteroidales bacterium]
MQENLVSVVIPAYNASMYIVDTLNSVIHQSYKNIEIIVVNDGSFDDTLEKVLSFSDERIIVINQENRGVSVARNKGLEISKGEFIVFFDADDIMDKYYLENLVKKLKLHPDANFCSSLVFKIHIDVSNVVEIKDSIYNNIAENVLLYLPKSTVPSAFMFRKDFLIKNKILFNPELSSTADREFLLKVHSCNGNGVICRSARLYYRMHENSMSYKLTPQLINDNVKFYDIINIKDYFKEKSKIEYAEFIKFYIISVSYLKIKSLKFIKYALELIKRFHLKSLYYFVKWKTSG